MCRNYTVRLGNITDLAECVQALAGSELAQYYFPDPEKTQKSLLEGVEKHEIYLIENAQQCVIGFFWLINNGIFHSYPYLHIIAIKAEYRGQGWGKSIMQYIEGTLLKDRRKFFLVVASFNARAKKFYLDLGFIEVGAIPNLYRDGITEYLMMKEKSA
jgi:ribosomal protein S18 acetylase RimI-like enzyme